MFFTSEGDEGPPFDDIMDITIDGTPVLSRSVYKPGGRSPFPDTPPYDGTSYSVSSGGVTNGSVFDDGRTGWQSFAIAITVPGTYTLQFLIADQKDSGTDSGLLIDNVQAPSPVAAFQQITNSSGSSLAVKGGGFVFAFHANNGVAMSDDGDTLAFVSTANITGDNPNAQTQVFVHEGTIFRRITSMVDGEADRPSLTSNGRWLAFSATADGNYEIYRVDLQQSPIVIQQITSTTGCSNRHPKISDNVLGDRIAYTSDCFGAGEERVVVWDQSTGFSNRGAAGCRSHQPAISRDAAGRYVGFLSDCDLTGGNADGNSEIFRWDLTGGGVTQITSSAGAANDGVASSGDGGFLSFISDADYTGGNADASLEVFRWSSGGGGSFVQLTDGTFFSLNLTADIDDTGNWLAVERLDLLTVQSSILSIDASTTTETSVVSGTDPRLPAIAVQNGSPIVAFESSGDFVGDNSDGNSEIFKANAIFDPGSLPLEICSSPGVGIPDNDAGGVSDTITVAPTDAITDLDVSVIINHTWVGDLQVDLTHIDTGTTRRLIDRPGTPPGNWGCSKDDIDAVLDDEGEHPVEDECAPGSPTISSPPAFTPNQSLDAFDGETMDGDWRITVRDLVGGNTGTLVEWCLLFEKP
jgi:hypothetical protein